MKKAQYFVLFFLLLVAGGAVAQKRRGLQLDADVVTRPLPGLNGLAVKDNLLQIIPATGQNHHVPGVDTLNGRAVINLPDYVAARIPDSTHIAIEADFVKVWQVAGYFATLNTAYSRVIVLRDSVELTFPKPGVDFTWDIHVLGFDHFTASTMYCDSVGLWAKSVYHPGDSVYVLQPQTVLYFSDTVYNGTGKDYRLSNYVATGHPYAAFRIRPKDTIRVMWDNKKKIYILTLI